MVISTYSLVRTGSWLSLRCDICHTRTASYEVAGHLSSCEGKVSDMFGLSRDNETNNAPSHGAGGASVTFLPQPLPEGELGSERSDWIGGHALDPTPVYYAGPAIRGQAWSRPEP